MLYEEAARASAFGVEMYVYGLYAACGALAALLLFNLLCKRARFPKGTAVLAGALMLPPALVVSRLLFCLVDADVRDALSLRALLMFTGGGYSMYGAIIGAFLGAYAAAKIVKVKALKLFDALAPSLMLFIAFARLGEGCLELPFGVSRPLTTQLMQTSFLAVEGEYEFYLRTYLLESFVAFLLTLWLLMARRANAKDGQMALLAAMLYGATQTILESLRFDAHMRVSFVGIQQVISMALLMLSVFLAARNARKLGVGGKLPVAAYIALPLSLGLGILLEFMIDRSGVSRYLLYLLFILDLSVPTYMGVTLMRKAAAYGKEGC